MRIQTIVLTATVASLFAVAAQAQSLTLEQRKKAGEVYVNNADEPPSFDINKQVDGISVFWLGHLYDGLFRYDDKGKLVPATAESFTVSADGLKWTFKIRKDAKWHDGKPVVAQNFVDSWQRLVDPAFASEYSFIAEAGQIKNASAIIAKKEGMTPDKLGVKAVDAQTLEVTLESPCVFFDSLMAFQPFYPIRKDVLEKFGEKAFLEADSIIGNGAFKLAKWEKDKTIRLEKAATFYNAKNVKISAIEEPVRIKDPQASFSAYQAGQLDQVGLGDPQVLKQAQDAKLPIKTNLDGASWYLELNTAEGKTFSNLKLRNVIQKGVNRGEFVNKIISTVGTTAAFGLVPDYMPGDKGTYRKDSGIKPWKDGDLAAAKKLLTEYLSETKQAKVPAFTIIAGDTTRAKKFSEYFQGYLSKLLDTEVKVENMNFKSRLQRMRDKTFDIVMAGWGPDYRDPMTFMDLFTSTNENNHTGWANAAFDKLIDEARKSPNRAKRVELFAKAEKILIDEAPIVSTHQTGGPFTQQEGLTGVIRSQFGTDPIFTYAYWSTKKN